MIEAYKKTGLPADSSRSRSSARSRRRSSRATRSQGLATLWSQTLAVEHRTPDEDLAGLQSVTVDDVNRVLRTYYDNATATVAISTPKEAAGSAFGGKQGRGQHGHPDRAHRPAAVRAASAQAAPRPRADRASGRADAAERAQADRRAVDDLAHRDRARRDRSTTPACRIRPAKKASTRSSTGCSRSARRRTTASRFRPSSTRSPRASTPGAASASTCCRRTSTAASSCSPTTSCTRRFRQQAFAIVKQQTVGSLTGKVKSPDYKAGARVRRTRCTRPAIPRAAPRRRNRGRHHARRREGVLRRDLPARPHDDRRRSATSRRSTRAPRSRSRSAGGRPPGRDRTSSRPRCRRTSPRTRRSRRRAASSPRCALGETMPLSYDDPDYPVLQLANTVLSGGFYASLLYHDLRELHGYVYNVGSGLSRRQNRSTFTRQLRRRSAERRARAAARRSTTSPPAEETARGRPADPREGARPRRAARRATSPTTGWPASCSPTRRRTGRWTRTASTRAAQLAATPERVRAAMAKWIRPNDFVRVVIGAGRKVDGRLRPRGWRSW